jgi:hypothetical protein
MPMTTNNPHAGRVAHALTFLRRTVAAAASNAARTSDILGLTHQPGDQVVDVVTGEELTVHAGHTVADLVHAPRPSLD